MAITLEQWKALVSVVDSGSYAKAAEALHKTQSSVTYLVQELQSRLGVKAFEQKGRKAVLTPTGQFLYRRAQVLLDEAAATERAAKKLSAGWEAEIGIAVEIAYPIAVLLDCLAAFSKESPHTRIEVIESVLGGTPEALLTGQADLAITGIMPAGFSGEFLMPVRFVPAAHPGHPIHKQPAGPQEFRRHRQLVVRESGQKRATRLRVEAAERWTVTHMTTSIEAATRGEGYGWYPEYRIAEQVATGKLKVIEMKEGGPSFAQLYLVYADKDAAGPGVQRLAEIIRALTASACLEAKEP